MSEKINPKAGDEVYDIHGQAASYVANSAHGHVVEPIYDDEDGEPHYSKPQVWPEVFKTPPTAKLHSEIAELEAKLSAARTELLQVQEQRRTEDSAYAGRSNERKRFAQLAKLDDYIAGKITHFVVERYYSSGVTIETFGEAMKSNESRYDKKLRLLSLYGDSGGDLSWRIDHYSDGSGSNYSGWYFPATSYEEAVSIASRRLDERYAKMRGSDPDRERCYASSLAKSARNLGLEVPSDVTLWAEEIDEKTRQSNLTHARKQLAEAHARVRELEST